MNIPETTALEERDENDENGDILVWAPIKERYFWTLAVHSVLYCLLGIWVAWDWNNKSIGIEPIVVGTMLAIGSGGPHFYFAIRKYLIKINKLKNELKNLRATQKLEANAIASEPKTPHRAWLRDQDAHPNISDLDLKRHLRILFIDDQDQNAVELLRDIGLGVIHKEDMNSSLEREVADGLNYDLIFLDIQGVGLSYEPANGLGILKALKSRGALPYIIAYTSKSYSLENPEGTELKKLSDAVVSKMRPEDYEKVALEFGRRAFSSESIVDELSWHTSRSTAETKSEIANLSINELDVYIDTNMTDSTSGRRDSVKRLARVIGSCR